MSRLGCLSWMPSIFSFRPVAIQSETSDFLTMWARIVTFWPDDAAFAAGAAWVAAVAVGAAAGAVVGAAAGAVVGAVAAAFVGAAAAAGADVGLAGAPPPQAASSGRATRLSPPMNVPLRALRRDKRADGSILTSPSSLLIPELGPGRRDTRPIG